MSAPSNRGADRIAITGMGVVSPIGQGLESYWSNLCSGVCGISPIERFSTAGLRVKNGGEIKTLRDLTGRLPMPHQEPDCRATQFLIRAAEEALELARWHETPLLRACKNRISRFAVSGHRTRACSRRGRMV